MGSRRSICLTTLSCGPRFGAGQREPPIVRARVEDDPCLLPDRKDYSEKYVPGLSERPRSPIRPRVRSDRRGLRYRSGSRSSRRSKREGLRFSDTGEMVSTIAMKGQRVSNRQEYLAKKIMHRGQAHCQEKVTIAGRLFLNNPSFSLMVNRKSRFIVVNTHEYMQKERKEPLFSENLKGKRFPCVHDL